MERGQGRGLTRADFGAGVITHFTPASLGPHWEKIHAIAAYRLDEFLRRAAVPFTITSTYRTPSANTAAAGSKASRHLPDAAGLSNAFDVWLRDPAFFNRDRAQELMRLAREAGFNGVGFYKGKPLIHVDVRPSPWSWLGEKIQTADGKQTMRFYPRDKIFDVLTGTAAGVAGVVVLALALLFFGRRHS